MMRSTLSKIVKGFSPHDVFAKEQPNPRHIPASQKQELFRYPELRQMDVERARLCAGRQNLLKYFVEVAVLYGDFPHSVLPTVENPAKSGLSNVANRCEEGDRVS
jgi:hypothetical protein